MTFDFTPEQQALVATRARGGGARSANRVAARDRYARLDRRRRLEVAQGAVADGALRGQRGERGDRHRGARDVSAGLGAHVGFAAAIEGSRTRRCMPQRAGRLAQQRDAARARRGRRRTRAGEGRGSSPPPWRSASAARRSRTPIASMKKAGVKPGPDETAPHWTFADGATDVAAARLLTYDAAQVAGSQRAADDCRSAARTCSRRTPRSAPSMRRFASKALRVTSKGGLLERLSRDADLQVILR